MDIVWRTVQLFLEEDGIAEVSLNSTNHSQVKCDCVAFQRSARCKHSKYVKVASAANDGPYAIEIPVDIDEEEAILAISNPEGWRNFVLKYGKVLVIDDKGNLI